MTRLETPITYTLAVKERRANVRRAIAGLHENGQVLVVDDGRVGRAVRRGVDRALLSPSHAMRMGDSQESEGHSGDDRESHGCGERDLDVERGAEVVQCRLMGMCWRRSSEIERRAIF